MGHLTWELAHPWAPHRYGWLVSRSGGKRWLIGQAVRYDTPAAAPGVGGHWLGCVRFVAVSGRVATVEEAIAAVETAWQHRLEVHPA